MIYKLHAVFLIYKVVTSYQTRTLCRRCFIPTIKHRVLFINVNYIFIWRYGCICIRLYDIYCWSLCLDSSVAF